jgi:hypothetical protein
MASKEVD